MSSFEVVGPFNNLNAELSRLKNPVKYNYHSYSGGTADYTLTAADLNKGFLELTNSGGTTNVLIPSYDTIVGAFSPDLKKGYSFSMVITSNTGNHFHVTAGTSGINVRIPTYPRYSCKLYFLIGADAASTYVIPVNYPA